MSPSYGRAEHIHAGRVRPLDNRKATPRAATGTATLAVYPAFSIKGKNHFDGDGAFASAPVHWLAVFAADPRPRGA